MRYKEKKGHWPLMKAKPISKDENHMDSTSEDGILVGATEKVAYSGSRSMKGRSVESVSPA